MDLLVYDEDDQRYVPAIIALIGVVVVALLVGATVFLLTRSPSPVPLAGQSPPQSAVPDTTSCAPALERADAALAVGERIERALADQTALVDELLAERASADQVLDQSLPQLTAGAKDRQDFLASVLAYQQERADCQR